MRQFVVLVGLLAVLAAPAVTLADTAVSVNVKADGTTTLDKTAVAGAVQAGTDTEVLLVQIVEEAATNLGTVTITLQLPVTMPANWTPRLIPSRCACQTSVERLDSRSFRLIATNVTKGGRLSLRGEFPAGTFRLSLSTRAALGAERFSPWILGLAVSIFLAALGLLGWMVHELAIVRKFKLTPTLAKSPPNELSAAMVSLIPSGKITAATLAAMLIHLAQRGFLTILNKGEDFVFAQDRELDLTGPGFALGSLPGEVTPPEELEKAKKEGVTIAEKFLLAKIFTQGHPTVDRREFKERLGRRLSSWKIGKVYAELYKEATVDGFFIRNPHLTHLRYRGVGIAIFFIGLVGFGSSFFLPGEKIALLLAWVAVALSGYVITRMVPYLPLMTVMGQAEWARWAGFRAYLTDPTPLPKSTPTSQFFAYLAFAFAFNELEAWSKRFGERKVAAPNWYLTEPKEQPVTAVAAEIDHLAKFVTSLLAAIHEHTVS